MQEIKFKTEFWIIALNQKMADNSRLRFGSNGDKPSPSRVPLARISELFDDDTLPIGDTNHNNLLTKMNGTEPQHGNATRNIEETTGQGLEWS